MLLRQEFLEALDGVERQMVVGDRIVHPEFGVGVLTAGWAGHVEARFECGSKLFTDSDDLVMIPEGFLGGWVMLLESDTRSWINEFNRKRDAALAELRECFQKRFLMCDELFSNRLCRHIRKAEFEREKVAFVQNWILTNASAADGKAPKIPDEEQAMAIATHGNHIQVVARAGSGKTETVANRAVFLQKHCSVRTEQMLLLAFNNKAAAEMVERIESKLGTSDVPHIMTFHALAYAIAPHQAQLLFNASVGGEQSLSKEFQRVLFDRLRIPQFESRVRDLMLAHFRADWERIINGGLNLDPEAMLVFRRSLASETIRGEYVKSFGEKVIANFLFEHGIPYYYEQNHRVNGRNYRPDFTLPKSGAMVKGVVIEYFGLIGDPDYDKDVAIKRNYWRTKTADWVFIELTPGDFADGPAAFESRVETKLRAASVQLRRLSEEEIWQLARGRAILRFTEAASGFVSRCRKMWLSPAALAEKALLHVPLDDIEGQFVDIAIELYGGYLDRLQQTSSDDFDGLMQKAILLLEAGKSEFSRKEGDGDLRRIRYLFVDEYQDFTELFHRMVSAIRAFNPGVEVFCVGDDCQAINRFAGSDLRYYREFQDIFRPATRLDLLTNRRSARPIVETSNSLMEGKGHPAKTGNELEGAALLVDLAKFKPSAVETSLFARAELTPVVLRIASRALGLGRTVVLLSVRNRFMAPGGKPVDLTQYLAILRSKLPVPVRDRLAISTTHGYKGKESDVVIILDATKRSYPLLHPNWIFSRILGESVDEIFDESRRLFYVALTRAKEAVFVITESGRESPFVTDIGASPWLREIDWERYPAPSGREWMTIKIGGPYESILPLIPCLKADGFLYQDLSGSGGVRSWDKSYKLSDSTANQILRSPWMVRAEGDPAVDGVYMAAFDGFDKPIFRYQFKQGELGEDTFGVWMPADLDTAAGFRDIHQTEDANSAQSLHAVCGGQVISDTLMNNFAVDCCSKALGGRLNAPAPVTGAMCW